jgi:hypothetical protein
MPLKGTRWHDFQNVKAGQGRDRAVGHAKLHPRAVAPGSHARGHRDLFRQRARHLERAVRAGGAFERWERLALFIPEQALAVFDHAPRICGNDVGIDVAGEVAEGNHPVPVVGEVLDV